MTHRMHWRERLQRTLDLWPYMAPLTLVYFAEYVLQVWLGRRTHNTLWFNACDKYLSHEHFRLMVPAERLKFQSSGKLHYLIECFIDLKLKEESSSTERCMDGDRVSSGQSRRQAHLLHLRQLGVPDRCLHI